MNDRPTLVAGDFCWWLGDGCLLYLVQIESVQIPNAPSMPAYTFIRGGGRVDTTFDRDCLYQYNEEREALEKRLRELERRCREYINDVRSYDVETTDLELGLI